MSSIALQTSDAGIDSYTLYMRETFLTRDNALHFEKQVARTFRLLSKDAQC
jgi:hypothetical protein